MGTSEPAPTYIGQSAPVPATGPEPEHDAHDAHDAHVAAWLGVQNYWQHDAHVAAWQNRNAPLGAQRPIPCKAGRSVAGVATSLARLDTIRQAHRGVVQAAMGEIGRITSTPKKRSGRTSRKHKRTTRAALHNLEQKDRLAR